MTAPTDCASSNSATSSSSWPASIFEKSRMSLITVRSLLPRRFDHPQILALLGGQGRVEGQVGHAEDAVHGRADLVAHVRQEFALGAVGSLGRVPGRGQFPRHSLRAAASMPSLFEAAQRMLIRSVQLRRALLNPLLQIGVQSTSLLFRRFPLLADHVDLVVA